MFKGDNKYERPTTESIEDLITLGEVICMSWAYMQARSKSNTGYSVFISHVENMFYIAPIAGFKDQMVAFNELIQRDSNLYNDTIMFIIDVVAKLPNAEMHFEKLVNLYNTSIKNLPAYDAIKINFKKDDYLECVMFALRFFIDKIDTYLPPPVQEEKKR